MPRPSTLAESLPPVLPASPEVAQAIDAYLSADAAARDASYLTPAHLAREAAWQGLEGLLLRLPRAWHVYKGTAWGLAKRSKAWFELVRRDPNTIRQA